MCSNWNLPLWFDVSACADVILGSQHKLIVKHPLRLVVQHSGWVQLYDLVVLHRQVMACALQVSDLFAPTREKRVIASYKHTEKDRKNYHTFISAKFNFGL